MTEKELEELGENGAKHLRRLWYRKYAQDGGNVPPPPDDEPDTPIIVEPK